MEVLENIGVPTIYFNGLFTGLGVPIVKFVLRMIFKVQIFQERQTLLYKTGRSTKHEHALRVYIKAEVYLSTHYEKQLIRVGSHLSQAKWIKFVRLDCLLQSLTHCAVWHVWCSIGSTSSFPITTFWLMVKRKAKSTCSLKMAITYCHDLVVLQIPSNSLCITW